MSKIKIDMVQRGNVPVVYAVQGEGNTRIVEATLYRNGEPFLAGGESVSLAFMKPDGTSGWYDTLATGDSAFSVDENQVTVTIAEEVLTVAGEVVAAIRIENPEGPGRSTTFPFLISVSPDPAINSPKSENYYKVQTWDEVNVAISELYDLIGSGGGGGGGGGFSPIVTVEPIEGGHRVTIIDAVGEQTFDIMDGKDGAPGADGKDGYTPVRGKDYWTEQDKNEIKSYVDEAILGGEW